MAKFLYQARAVGGQLQSGQMEAASESEVAAKIRSQKLTPLKIVAAPRTKTNSSQMFSSKGKNVPSKEMQIFTRQFSTLIDAGIPIVDSLRMLSEGKRNPTLKDAAIKVRMSIESGKRLGDAMSAIPNVFDRFYVNMVRAGEQAGILDGILTRLAIYMEKSEKTKKQVKGAMVYPISILVVAALVITGIMVFIIPKFQELYKSSGQQLPWITQMVVNMSDFMIKKWYIIIGGLVVAPYLFISWYRTEEGKETVDRILIKAPLFGELIQKASVARMTRTLSTLLGSGVGVIEALDIASKTAGNKVIEDALARCKDAVTSGKPLAVPLSKEKMIPDMVTQMISIGEQSGSMDTMLGKIADFYEDDVENAVKGLTSMIEPIMMVVLGSAVAVLVVAMYLPIFNMGNLSGG